jgi:hypothetical protein
LVLNVGRLDRIEQIATVAFGLSRPKQNHPLSQATSQALGDHADLPDRRFSRDYEIAGAKFGASAPLLVVGLVGEASLGQV